MYSEMANLSQTTERVWSIKEIFGQQDSVPLGDATAMNSLRSQLIDSPRIFYILTNQGT
jgi:hypothetical protein